MAGFSLKPLGCLPPFYRKIEPRGNSFTHRRRVGGITIFVRSPSNVRKMEAAEFLNDAISLQIPRGTRAIDATKYWPGVVKEDQ